MNNTENIEENTIEKKHNQKTLRAVLNNTENYSPSTNTKALTFFLHVACEVHKQLCLCLPTAPPGDIP